MTQAQGNPQDKNARIARGLAVSGTAVSKKFGRYKKEEGKAVRKADVKEDEVIKQLKDVWGKLEIRHTEIVWGGKLKIEHPDGFLDSSSYDGAVGLIENLSYSPRHVELFSLALVEFRDDPHFKHKAGPLLSALINKGEGKEFRIHTKHMGMLGIEIGISLEKEGTRITIEGDGGLHMGVKEGFGVIRGNTDNTVAYGMKGGKVIVEGSVSPVDGVGFKMKGGEAIVKGDVLGCIGRFMKGGIIRVYGDATQKNVDGRPSIGEDMEGGEIYLYGDYIDDYGTAFDKVIHGKIYHKGKLIVDK